MYSVVHQTSPRWQLLIGLDDTSPLWIDEWILGLQNERVRFIRRAESGFARSINTLMREADTEFVSLLLSDDRYTPDAVETLLSYRRRYRDVDFFYSGRRCIDASGKHVGRVYPSKKRFTIDHFKRGSPVKHLLCWRRGLAIEIGGIDEALSLHGADDYDFPWSMAEASAKFRAIKTCLYEYREHRGGGRLTTDTPLDVQIQTLERMFAKHKVSREDTCAYLQGAADNYLPEAHMGRHHFSDSTPEPQVHCFRATDDGAWDEFSKLNMAKRHFFPHCVTVLPRGGPDGYKLAKRMGVATKAVNLREVVLFAQPEAAPEVPLELYMDADVAWHQQQLGLPRQVAVSALTILDGALYVTMMTSDLVQRISRRRDHLTRVEKRFRGWVYVMLNALMNYALDRGAPTVYVPTSQLSLRYTDPARCVKSPLFKRIYDDTLNNLYIAERSDDWWAIDLRKNATRIARLTKRISLIERQKTICITHDIERGLGHTDIDPDFAERANKRAPAALPEMLEIERKHNIKATYCVVGSILNDHRSEIEADGHALGFHSYEHVLPLKPSMKDRIRRRFRGFQANPDAAEPAPDYIELVRCRAVDYRINGYRPPRSMIGSGLDDQNLAYFNFEWLASSCSSLGTDQPYVENGIVKIPVHMDDFPLHTGRSTYKQWRDSVFEVVEKHNVSVIGLHDCYADHWLPHYPSLLEMLKSYGSIRTLNEVCNDYMIGSSSWV